MSDWAKILEAVKEPISLAALSLLVVMVVLRQVLKKIAPIAGKSGYKLALSVVSIVGLLSFFAATGAIGYKFYELRTTSSYQITKLQTEANLELSKLAASQAKPVLSRIDMEMVVQKHRGSIENCLKQQPKTLYLDFVVQNGKDGQLNVDVLNGVQTGFVEAHPMSLDAGISPTDLSREMPGYIPKGDAYFVTGDMGAYPLVTVASSRKLSVTAPEVNRCILDTIRDSIMAFGPPQKDFKHRYITDKGSRASREYRNAMEEKISFALHDGHFEDAERVEEQAEKIGYSVVNKTLIQKARREYAKVKDGQITKEEYDSRLTDLETGDLLR